VIQVRDLKIVRQTYFDEILKNEKLKSKLYTAIVWSKNPISKGDLETKLDVIKDLQIN